MRSYIYDIEVMLYDWIVVFKEIGSDHYDVFHNDTDNIRNWINKRSDDLLIGFNNKHYDDYILKAIYHRASPGTVKELNDYIVKTKKNGWEFPFLRYKKKTFTTADLRDDIADRGLSLKAIEGNLNLPIIESSVDFDIGRKLTDAEVDETIYYCKKDVDATEKLYGVRSEYIASKKLVGSMYGLDEREAVGYTNAKLSAKVLGAVKTDYYDERDYRIPDAIKRERIPKDILMFFLRIHDETISDKALFSSSLNVVVRTSSGDCPCTYAWGGVHGAKPCYTAESTSRRKIKNRDVASLYPNSMLKFGYCSRSMSDPDAYKNIVSTRLGYKHTGEKAKANALKLVINTTYGAMLTYNDLNDPKCARSVCITNQLCMTDLIYGLATNCPSFDIINFNTDGVMYHIAPEDEEMEEAIVDEWCNRTGFELELDMIKKIIQKDVNNYIEIKEDGSIKTKGSYVNIVSGGTFKMNSLRAVQLAVSEYLIKGTPVDQTIETIDDIHDFQQIAKTGSSYSKCIQIVDGKVVEVNKVNRVYASKDQTLGTLYKVKYNDGVERRDKVASIPDHCIIDNENHLTIDQIDRSYYVEMAKKRIDDFLVIKKSVQKNIDKMEVITMTASKATTTKATTKPETGISTKDIELNVKDLNVFQRLNLARVKFLSTPVKKSGRNKFAGFDYFELDDIIPVAQPILVNYGLCFHITFLYDHATALLRNVDDPEDFIEFQTPIVELDTRAKGMNSNQALGAVETYARRRLWMSMLELVEQDINDAISGSDKIVPAKEAISSKTKPKKADESSNKKTEDDPNWMKVPEGTDEEIEMLTPKTEKAIKGALKELRDKDGDEVYIKDCLMRLKNMMYEPEAQKLLVEVTEKL